MEDESQDSSEEVWRRRDRLVCDGLMDRLTCHSRDGDERHSGHRAHEEEEVKERAAGSLGVRGRRRGCGEGGRRELACLVGMAGGLALLCFLYCLGMRMRARMLCVSGDGMDSTVVVWAEVIGACQRLIHGAEGITSNQERQRWSQIECSMLIIDPC